jgi:hypothetical protein
MIKDLLLTLLNNGHSEFVNTFAAIPDDKLDWRPLDTGRSALDLFAETAQMADVGRRIIESRGQLRVTRDLLETLRAERASWSREEALAALEINHAGAIAAVEACSDDELAQPITIPMISSEMTMPLAAWALMGYRQYISRFAQINYIQTLYGDTDFH